MFIENTHMLSLPTFLEYIHELIYGVNGLQNSLLYVSSCKLVKNSGDGGYISFCVLIFVLAEWEVP